MTEEDEKLNNEIEPIQSAEITEATPISTPMSFTQTGNNGTQVGHADTVNNNFNVSVVDTSAFNSDGTINKTSTQLSHEYYNLFVLGRDTQFDGLIGSFIVQSDRVLEKGYTEEKIRNQFIYLTEVDRETIKTYPALFMSENREYGEASANQMAYWGRVTNIYAHGKDTKIKYHFLKEIPQQKLNELSSELCLARARSFNELNHTHWAIKNVNLLEELSDAHIDLF